MFNNPVTLATVQDSPSLKLSFPYYGISTSVLQNLGRMNSLAASKKPLDQENLDSFELQLYLAFPSATDGGYSPTLNASMIDHMSQAVYYASVVFFRRSVRREPVDEAQTLVENGVKHLEAIESVSKGSAGSVMMWPALVLGAECSTHEVQVRLGSWFQKKQKLGFRNVKVLERLIRSLWRIRASGDIDTGWQDLIEEEEFDVFRL